MVEGRLPEFRCRVEARDGAGSLLSVAETSPNGLYRLGGLPSGDVQLRAWSVEGAECLAVERRLFLASRGNRRVDLDLGTGFTLRGRVRWEDGRPGRGLAVQCFGPSGVPLARTVTNQEGQFACSGLERGAATLSFPGSGAVVADHRVDLPLDPGMRSDFILSAGAVLLIAVDGPGGGPMDGARVTLLPHGRHGVADAAGQVRLDGLPPGGVRVQVEADGHVPATVLVTLDSHFPAHASLQMEAAGQLIVTCVRAGGGPAEGHVVVAEGATRAAANGITDSAGEVLLTGLPGGWHWVSAAGAVKRVAIVPGDTVAVKLVLP